MAREKWTDIAALYKTYIGIIEPLLRETSVIIRELDPEELLDPEVIAGILDKETKRKLKKVKVIAEFNAFFRGEIFRYISNYIQEVREEFDPIDVRDYVLDFLDEAIAAFNVLMDLVVEDTRDHKNSLLYELTAILSDILLPQGKSLEEIYDFLIEQSEDWYEVQRYIMRSTTYYREKLTEMEIPGLSPKTYQLLNQITSLFNLEPNYLDMPEDPNIVIPGIMKSDVFEPYIKNIANNEEEAINRIVSRLELRVVHDLFICPNSKFLKLTEPHRYVATQQDSDGKTRYLPQSSNETLILLYLSQISFRRGFLSKELINWIAMNFAFIIYMGILRRVLSDDNIFYNLFLDLKTEEKILPYLMKLICFPDYIRLDRNKIRDSPVYRKELFTFLGSKIEALSDLTFYISEEVDRLLSTKETQKEE